MPEHLISIIMPLRNAGLYITEALQSVQAQDYKQWECHIINDHSKDTSAEQVEHLAQQDARIHLHNNAGRGIIDALQTGLRRAQGSWVSRFDADDIMPAGRLQLLAKALSNSPEGTVVTGLVQYFADYAITPGYQRYENWLNEVNRSGRQRENMYRECTIASPNWLISRSDLEAAGGFEGLDYPEDYDLTLRWYAAGYHFKVVPKLTLHWREHGARTSRNARAYKQKAFFELKVRRFLQIDKRDVPLVLWGTGQKGKLSAKILDRYAVPFQWMALHPEWHPQGLQGKPIQHYKKIAALAQPQVLIAVYPPEPERKRIAAFLECLGLQEGRDYWYL